MLKRNTILRQFFLILIFINAYSSNDKDKITQLLNNSKKFYEKAENFQFFTNYKLYAKTQPNLITEQYEGIFIKSGNNYYSKVNQTEFIKKDKINLKIDHDNKRISYNNLNTQNDHLLDMTQYLNNFSDFELKSNSNDWICILSTPAITFIPYSKVIFYIDKKTFQINKQQMVYIDLIKFVSKQGEFKDYPVIEIRYYDYRITNLALDKISIDKYIILKGGGKIAPTGLYKGYSIID